jgi:lipoprotein-anchoring transpeptidase ErfK/SrfK
VRTVQQGLVSHGYKVVVDGIFGNQTEGAVRNFQSAKGLPATGVVDQTTWNAVTTPPPPPPPGALRPASPGARSANVTEIQRTLINRGFWVAGTDGYYGHTTTQAVMAFQKYVGLPRTGTADQATINALTYFRGVGGWPVARARAGNHVQVDKTKQLLFVLQDGRVRWVVNTSTGNDKYYCEPNQRGTGTICGTAYTYEGVFNVYRQRSDGWVKGDLGEIYRPKFVKNGVAIHGSRSIPGYPASHGCIRVSVPFMDHVWATNLIPLYMTVWVYK